MLDRYAEAIKKIGGAPGLLGLPEAVKEALKTVTDLKAKVETLELIARKRDV